MLALPPRLLVPPRVVPPLDPGFRPAVLATRAQREIASAARAPVPIGLAVEQPDGTCSRFAVELEPSAGDDAPLAWLLRLAKVALYARGGFRLHVSGPSELVLRLKAYFAESETGRFDRESVAERIYGRALEISSCRELPAERVGRARLGGHWGGGRVGLDLGATSRKVVALEEGRLVFGDRLEWAPVEQTDPDYHADRLFEAIERAARALPRLDAVGVSAAGVYLDGQVRIASLFRAVPAELFETRVRPLFSQLAARLGGVPLAVANDGEVAALAAARMTGETGLLALCLGSSTGAGFVAEPPPGGAPSEAGITSWLNELAFVPIDESPDAPTDAWSGERGCAAQYLSQEGIARLLPRAGLEGDPGSPLSERVRRAAALVEEGNPRARAVYETVGVYTGYAIAQYAEAYPLRSVALFGGIAAGAAGEVLARAARRVLDAELPERSSRLRLHLPPARERTEAQAEAAASLPDASHVAEARCGVDTLRRPD